MSDVDMELRRRYWRGLQEQGREIEELEEQRDAMCEAYNELERLAIRCICPNVDESGYTQKEALHDLESFLRRELEPMKSQRTISSSQSDSTSNPPPQPEPRPTTESGGQG